MSAEARLYTRSELPTWVRPVEHHQSNTSYFFGVPLRIRDVVKGHHGSEEVVQEVRQVIFAINAAGAAFLDLIYHRRRTVAHLPPGALADLPGCVLIAVGVEQIRRARGGR